MENPLSWFTPRGYLHFDHPCDQLFVEKFVSDPANIAKHAFYPFIGFDVHSTKIAYNKVTNTIYLKDKVRPIAYAAHLDSQIYSYYSQNLSAMYEQKLNSLGLEANVLAFRKLQKGNIEFANEVFSAIRISGNCHVIALDIEKFFDKIDHEILKKEWCKLINQRRLPEDHFRVFESLSKHTKVNRYELFKKFNLSFHNPHKDRRMKRICNIVEFRKEVREAGLIKVNEQKYGIPQGSPISAFLSNLYLLDFDNLIVSEVSKVGGKYFRYCDDIFIIVPNDPDHYVNLAIDGIKKLGLTINESKKEIRKFYITPDGQRCDRPVQYLGFVFDGQKIVLRSASLARFSAKMKKGVWIAKSSMHKINAARAKRGQEPRKIYRKKIYERYSYIGKHNFISYGLKAAKTMDSDAIRKQLKPLWSRLQKEINLSEKKIRK